ncbi:MAG TPA: UDP-N-acetylglucosamine 2-epimerase (non-hydrolyzing) [Acidobacteriota bacterium]|nr:UDP-N-acetylglucosamine 2-epimerase (non-hydrolyzing) [Acidobacteriota bacterium]
MPEAIPGTCEPHTVVLICGARPNFVKIAALHRALSARPGRCRPLIVHTGQHYSPELSDVFFRELEIPPPDLHLNVGSGSHGEQTARALTGIEACLMHYRPDLMVCVGDVNSTLAAALAAAKCRIPSAHVEAGLRSGDRAMPEEINRIVADHLCDWLYTTTDEANDNLRREGIDPARIVFAGNVMIDTLYRHLPRVDREAVLRRLRLAAGSFVLLTMHRPANVDDPDSARRLIETIRRVAQHHHVVFPMHPRTRARLSDMLQSDSWTQGGGGRGVTVCEPLGYHDFVALQQCAFAVLTDSGGIQEETTALGVPCLTLRPNTERYATVSMGTNALVGLDPERVMTTLETLPAFADRNGAIFPRLPFWDGHAAERIAEHICTRVLGTDDARDTRAHAEYVPRQMVGAH